MKIYGKWVGDRALFAVRLTVYWWDVNKNKTACFTYPKSIQAGLNLASPSLFHGRLLDHFSNETEGLVSGSSVNENDQNGICFPCRYLQCCRIDLFCSESKKYHTINSLGAEKRTLKYPSVFFADPVRVKKTQYQQLKIAISGKRLPPPAVELQMNTIGYDLIKGRSVHLYTNYGPLIQDTRH